MQTYAYAKAYSEAIATQWSGLWTSFGRLMQRLYWLDMRVRYEKGSSPADNAHRSLLNHLHLSLFA
jgi:hypothetical protein